MQLNEILSNRAKCSDYKLSGATESYFRYEADDFFYVEPTFDEIRPDKDFKCDNPKFILFSAPGATGKSALAKHISNQYHGIYWDLAKIKLGTNSFVGTVVSAVGSDNYSSFIHDLKNSKAILIIDAFDEAEIISGRKMLADFIQEINKEVSSYKDTPIILLSRTETAQFLMEQCLDKKILIQHYEIGYFNNEKAIEFVTLYIKNKKIQVTTSTINCIKSYFDVVRENLQENESSSFLGYAPVLEAISEHIAGESNTSKLINELKTQENSAAIIYKIMEDLLYREQSKVRSALETRDSDIKSKYPNYKKLFEKEEQLSRLLFYIIFNETKYENYEIKDISHEIIDEYKEVIDQFLPQHPFIIKKLIHNNVITDFAGPAFRDYALAKLLLTDSQKQLALMYFDERMYFDEHKTVCLPTSIFFDCYMFCSENKIHSQHLNYVYKAFKAKEKADETAFIQCVESSNFDSPLDKGFVDFELYNNNLEKKLFCSKTLECDSDILKFDNISNASLLVPSFAINIGRDAIDSRIENSKIVCNSINWISKNIIISSGPTGVELESINECPNSQPNFEIINGSKIKISIPNISHYYKLLPYKYDFESSEDLSVDRFAHALRAILIEFRTHKKDTLAKDAERIINVTVGNSPLKNAILRYLINYKIIYKEGHLYKINIEQMSARGINFSFLGNYSTLERAYLEFLDFNKSTN